MVPIPLTDHIRRRTFWAFTLLLIVANVWVFIIELSLGPHLNRFILLNGLIPARYSPGHLVGLPLRLTVAPIFISMFLHGGWLHLLGNMLFLWVFGRNIEDLIGGGRFLAFYLLSGLAAAVVQVLANPYSRVPTIGASGAIAGVMGAYLIRFPRSQIDTLAILFIFVTRIAIPAPFYLLFWFGMQFLNGYESIGDRSYTGGGVAWFAHIGGFIAGMLLIKLFPSRQRWRHWYDES